MPFTESNYENAILQLFTQTLGYSYAYGPEIERDYHSPLYEDELLPALQTINPNLPQAALDDAVYKLKTFESGSLLQKNMVFTDYLQNGVPVKFVVKGEERSGLVYLVDYQHPKRNQFTAINQWTVMENSKSGPMWCCLSTACPWWWWSSSPPPGRRPTPLPPTASCATTCTRSRPCSSTTRSAS